MSVLAMLDVAIGIIFIYLLLSLVCTAINEIIEGIFKNRATDLLKGISELLNDTSKQGLTKSIYQHPLILGLFKGVYNPKSKQLPSYIPARNFALALMDLVTSATSTGVSGASGATPASIPIKPMALGAALVPTAIVPPTPLTPYDNLRASIVNNATINAHTGKALLTLIDAAAGDMNKVRENIENWFNSSMDRVAGWYKRRVQFIILFLGLSIAVALNADTIAIFKSLVNDPPLRASLLEAAREYAKENPTITSDTSKTAEARIKENMKKMDDLRLPIGWEWDENSALDNNHKNNVRLAIPSSFWGWILKGMGWIVTAAAISLGAPFWFDLLNKFMVIRSTVKPTEKSPDEGSEDRVKK
jgi:hypothetical protein